MASQDHEKPISQSDQPPINADPTPSPTQNQAKAKSKGGWLIFAGVLVLMVIIAIAKNKPPTKIHTDYEAAVQLAKKQDKPVLLAFVKENVFNSGRLKTDILQAPSYRDLLDQFVVILIDSDKQKNLATRYNVTGFPTCVFLWPSQDHEVDRMGGYIRPERFSEKAKEALENKPK